MAAVRRYTAIRSVVVAGVKYVGGDIVLATRRDAREALSQRLIEPSPERAGQHRRRPMTRQPSE